MLDAAAIVCCEQVRGTNWSKMQQSCEGPLFTKNNANYATLFSK
jgi:hypothetical protein